MNVNRMMILGSCKLIDTFEKGGDVEPNALRSAYAFLNALEREVMKAAEPEPPPFKIKVTPEELRALGLI